MSSFQEDIEKLKEYNQRLTKLLEHPEPGLFAWISAVTKTIDAMRDVTHQEDDCEQEAP